VQGKTAEAAKQLIIDAKMCEEAGAFAVVLECVPKQIAEQVTTQLTIPTIGIGAGVYTDGQVLVFHDLLSFGVNRVPKFVKKYGDVNRVAMESIGQYIRDVKNGTFPEEGHSYSMKNEELIHIYGGK